MANVTINKTLYVAAIRCGDSNVLVDNLYINASTEPVTIADTYSFRRGVEPIFNIWPIELNEIIWSAIKFGNIIMPYRLPILATRYVKIMWNEKLRV